MGLRVALTALVISAAALVSGAPAPDASTGTAPRHLLVIRERGHDHVCLSRIRERPTDHPQKPSDRYQLRAPAASSRALVVRAISAAWTPGRCGINVIFRVHANLGRFGFYDATTGAIWLGLRLPRLVGGQWRRTVTR
jgi:hypothetical protein